MRTVTAAIVPLLLVLLTWLSFRAINTNAELFDRALAALDDFAMAESELHRDVLAARAGVLRNYDPLVREMAALNDALVRLREVDVAYPEIATATGRLADSVRREEPLVEQFKSNNALLQNSLAHFGLLSVHLGTSGEHGPLVPAVSALVAAMLHLTLDTSPAAVHEVEARLGRLAMQARLPGDTNSIQPLLAHGRLLHDLLPVTDGVLKELFAVPTGREQAVVRSAIVTRQIASRNTARRYRVLLYATSLLLLGLLVHLGLRLRTRARALRHRAVFEHVITDISMRFISSRPQEIGAHIDQALAQLAKCVGADRAYFVVAGAPARVHAWCRQGVSFPSDWPERVLALSARFAPTEEGIIHVPRVDHLRPGADRDVLAAAGVHSWACVARIGGQVPLDLSCTVGSLLGFDVVLRDRHTRSGELGLLRMALDAIANAVGRELLERERVRLEQRLQQARRMETIGALASGIAHNFNNIIGAILGYTEMAEAQIAPDSRPARNLGEIRRSGERARDLVEEILTFGRRRDARRKPVEVKALLAEVRSLLHASLPRRIKLVVCDAPEAAIIAGEAGQLQQVILNLCSNAAQAMDDAGRIEIKTEVREVTQTLPLTHGGLVPGCYVRIAVNDAGRGMDETMMKQIFEPFFTTRLAGNGLGLATVREIVREHGGAIKVWSKPGVGSRFEVWLPCDAVAEARPEKDTPPVPLGHGEAILVIEAEREQLLRNEELLAALGYEPVGFTCADDALAAYRAVHERFDALVVGHVEGASAIDLAAKLDQLALNLPIVLATASADEISADRLVTAAVSEVVHRPLQAVEVAAALTRCLAARQSRSKRYDRNAFPRPEMMP